MLDGGFEHAVSIFVTATLPLDFGRSHACPEPYEGFEVRQVRRQPDETLGIRIVRLRLRTSSNQAPAAMIAFSSHTAFVPKQLTRAMRERLKKILPALNNQIQTERAIRACSSIIRCSALAMLYRARSSESALTEIDPIPNLTSNSAYSGCTEGA